MVFTKPGVVRPVVIPKYSSVPVFIIKNNLRTAGMLGMRTLLVPGLLMAAGILLAFSRTMPGRRLLPYWGRIVDIFEYVFAIATVVLLLAVFDAFTTVRAMAG